MSVHYKFKTSLEHNSVSFDGMSISVADLKKSILYQKKMGKCSGFELKLTNAQTEEVYDNDETLIPKNTSVIVSRLPVQDGTKNKRSDKPDLPLLINKGNSGLIRYDRIVKKADLVNANTTEEEKIKAMINQSSQEYDPSNYVKNCKKAGPAPFGFACHNCGVRGHHWTQNCPTRNTKVKRSTGIPRSFMVTVDGPEHKGALLTSSGNYAVPLINLQAYMKVKKEKPPFVPQDEPVAEPKAQVPKKLLCMICNELLQDAVMIRCCKNSFCDECVRQVLLDSENHECPTCHQTEVSPDSLMPNYFLRTAVAKYNNGQEEVSSVSVKKAPSVPQPASSVPMEGNSPQVSPDSPAINTIETITNVRNKSKYSHSANLHPEFPNQRPHQGDWFGYNREDYHGRYEQKPERSSHRTHYDRSDGESWYTSSSYMYSSSEPEHSDPSFVASHYKRNSSRHPGEMSMPPLHRLLIPPVVPPIHLPAILPSALQVFSSQTSPSGAFPMNAAQIPSQPSPPGVRPPLRSLSNLGLLGYGSQPFAKDDPHKVEKSIDDRKLERRDRDRYSRDRSLHRSRSSDLHRPRSSLRSRRESKRSRIHRRSRSSDLHRPRSSLRSRRESKTRSRIHRRSRSSDLHRPHSSLRSRRESKSRSWIHRRSRSSDLHRPRSSQSQSRSTTRIATKACSRSRDRRREGSRDRKHRLPRSRGSSRSSSPRRHRPTHSAPVQLIDSSPIECCSPMSMTDSSSPSAQYNMSPQKCQQPKEGQGDSHESVTIKAQGTGSDHSKPLKIECHEFDFEPDYEPDYE